MPVTNTRRKHQQHLRDVTDNEDDFKENEPHDAFGSGGSADRSHRPPPPHSPAESNAFLNTFSDENSELSRFLFIGRGDVRKGNIVGSSHFSNDIDETMPSMGKLGTLWCALALEPMDKRNERIIMSFEAFAIFGALIINSVWFLYEWGSWRGYGGFTDDVNNQVDNEASNILDFFNTAFEFVMALTLSCNIFLALFGAYFWIFSINVNSSHPDFVFESRKALMYLHNLMMCTLILITIGLFLGIISNMSPNWILAGVGIIIVAFVGHKGFKIAVEHSLTCTPLVSYHCPKWYKNIAYFRFPKEDLKLRAGVRAQELRKKAHCERKKLELNLQAIGSNPSSVAKLLRTAATNQEIMNELANVSEDELTR